jgi:hypothetical protein
MRCSECGAPNAETAQLCIRCEAPLARQRSAAEPAVEGSGGVTVARQRAPEAGQVVLEDAPSAQRAGSGSSRRRALVLAGAGLVVLAAATVVIVAAISSVPSTSVSSARHLAEGQLRPGDCVRAPAWAWIPAAHGRAWLWWCHALSSTWRRYSSRAMSGRSRWLTRGITKSLDRRSTAATPLWTPMLGARTTWQPLQIALFIQAVLFGRPVTG